MVRTVVVYGVAAQVAQLIHIPCGVFNIPATVKAVPDIAAGDFLIACTPPIPKSQVSNHKDGLVKLDVQIDALIVQISVIDLIHQGHALVLGQLRMIFLQIVPPVLIVQIVVAPY